MAVKLKSMGGVATAPHTDLRVSRPVFAFPWLYLNLVAMSQRTVTALALSAWDIHAVVLHARR